MKSLVLAFGLLFAVSLFSCTGETQQNDQQDAVPIR